MRLANRMLPWRGWGRTDDDLKYGKRGEAVPDGTRLLPFVGSGSLSFPARPCFCRNPGDYLYRAFMAPQVRSSVGLPQRSLGEGGAMLIPTPWT